MAWRQKVKVNTDQNLIKNNLNINTEEEREKRLRQIEIEIHQMEGIMKNDFEFRGLLIPQMSKIRLLNI